MAKSEKRKGGGGKLSRSQTVTVRLDPKLRYLAELAARSQRRTVSSFVEWAIEVALNEVPLSEGATVAEDANYLWDVDEPDRFAKLALAHPDMLTHDEQVLWKLIKENGYMWKGQYEMMPGGIEEWTWSVDITSLIIGNLRKHWDTFTAVARGELPPSELPDWIIKKSLDLAHPSDAS